MNRFPIILLNCLLGLTITSTMLGSSSDPSIRAAIVGDAILNNKGYELLETMTIRYGPRARVRSGPSSSRDSSRAFPTGTIFCVRSMLPGGTFSADRNPVPPA